jgi:DNA-nicking Smr family endonuclease
MADPDYAGPEGNRLRAEAQKFADERSNYLSSATKAFEAGEKAKAKELSDKGKQAGRQMEEANRKAAEVILHYRNDGHEENYLDLHGLYLEEAMTAFRTRLDKLIARNEMVVFEVIPGAGNHSKNKAIIKPKVIEELQTRKLRFEEKNAGTLLVYLNESQPKARDRTKDTNDSQNTRSPTTPSSEGGPAPKTSRFSCCIVM